MVLPRARDRVHKCTIARDKETRYCAPDDNMRRATMPADHGRRLRAASSGRRYQTMATKAQTGLPKQLEEFVDEAVSLGDARKDQPEGGDQRAAIDAWLLRLSECSTSDQVRVAAQLRARNQTMAHGLNALREAAVAQLQVIEANRLVVAAGSLKWVGFAVSLVGLCVAFAQLLT